jgi:sphingolipid delta-4 desaturase
MVIINFIRDTEVGIFARAKRLSKEKMTKAKTDGTVKRGLLDSSDSDKSE